MSAIRRYRLAEGPVLTWTLCLASAAEELGVPVMPDDDLVLLYPVGTEREEVDGAVELLRSAGHEVVETEAGS